MNGASLIGWFTEGGMHGYAKEVKVTGNTKTTFQGLYEKISGTSYLRTSKEEVNAYNVDTNFIA